MQKPFTFHCEVDLGEGGGVVSHEFVPYFSASQLVVLRFPLPFELEAKQVSGVMKVVQTGLGLLEGDILRAFSTLELRYDSELREVRFGEGITPQRATPLQRNGLLREVERRLGMISAELGGFMPKPPTRCLFITDGQPLQKVTDALVANTPDKAREIVMVFERPLD